MKKVLLIPTHCDIGSGGGIRVYNESIVDLFKDDKDFKITILSDLPKNSLFGIKYNYKYIKKIIQDLKPDIIHINGYTTLLPKQLIKIAEDFDIKIVYTAHWHPFHSMKRSYLKYLYFKINIQPYIKYIDKIICINKEEYNFFIKFSSKLILIPHWRKYKLETKDVTKDPKMILFVGNPNYSNKGFEHVLRLPIGLYDIHVVGKSIENLRSDIYIHTNISDDELISLYKRASLTIVPSHYEAFSYVALESLTQGTPIVISNKVRIADYLNGLKGYSIFKLGDYEDFKDKIKNTIGTKVDTEAVNNIFSRKEAYNRYRMLYSQV